MAISTLLQLASIAGVSFVSAVLALWALGLFTRVQASAPKAGNDEDGDIVFEFDEHAIIRISTSGQDYLGMAPNEEFTPEALIEIIGSRFPDLDEQLAELPECGSAQLAAIDGSARLDLEWRQGRTWLKLTETPELAETGNNPPASRAIELELETLRLAVQTAPFLLWRQDVDGEVGWANAAYLALAHRKAGNPDQTTWPPVALFRLPDIHGGQPIQNQRLGVDLPDESQTSWFEVSVFPLREDYLCMATSAARAVRAEKALRDFVQTLTKTFAHLNVGLAIFDRQRRLTLFNPALTDLTQLAPSFLSSRPTLPVFLDRLRDQRMIPEPRDYKSWRQRIFELESDANKGCYEETWPLPNGQTYRITGRPHPDGGLAFLFEDRSAEISLARRFRAELETGQAVLDSFDEALAVFSPSGTMTLSNAAYARLWGVDPSTSMKQLNIAEATQAWSERCAPSPVWDDLREFVVSLGDRSEWNADVRLIDGRGLHCRFAPLAGGATLVGFAGDRAGGKRLTGSESRTIEGAEIILDDAASA